MENERVTRMRQLLAEANTPAKKYPEALTAFLYRDDSAQMRGTVKRRVMIKELQRDVRQYDLRLDLEAYLAVADCASLAGLDTRQLITFKGWVDGVVDRLSTAADSPDAPLAR